MAHGLIELRSLVLTYLITTKEFIAITQLDAHFMGSPGALEFLKERKKSHSPNSNLQIFKSIL